MPDVAADALYAPSLVEVATRQLREEILSGKLEPGQRLIEEQIRQRFDISRAPLREALRLLAQQGLVEHLPRRGARVTEWSDVDIEQLFGLRTVLERHAIVSAFPMPSSPGVDRLASVRARLDEMSQADRQGDQLQKDDAHRAFHAAVVGLAGNRQLDLAMEPILLKLQRPMAVNLRREAKLVGPQEGLQRHERLLRALETNDREVVLAALLEHGGRRFLDSELPVPTGGIGVGVR
ncbi:MAG: GntR family transcriptional regulator [Propionibacteriaceae bacterium]